MAHFDNRIEDYVNKIDGYLESILPIKTIPPTDLHEAMHYSIFAHGKRIRPILALATGEALGGDPEQLIYLACALEMIHTYSLIHDDLPAMDNDKLRRGKPTCHIEFDEATAILAGDGLLTLVDCRRFRVVTAGLTSPPPKWGSSA